MSNVSYLMQFLYQWYIWLWVKRKKRRRVECCAFMHLTVANFLL